MESRTNDLTSQIETYVHSHHEELSAYPKRGNRFFLPLRQDCYQEDEVTLLEQIRTAYSKMSEGTEANYFDLQEENHLKGWWKCLSPRTALSGKHGKDFSFGLPSRDEKDTKQYPLWDYANQMARQVAHWQAERVHGQQPELMNDPVMLVLQELRDWFFNVIAIKECRKEDLAALVKRQAYLKTLVLLIPDFGKDRSHLHEVQQSFEQAYRIIHTCVANQELPELLKNVVVDAKNLESMIGTHLHFLLINDKVGENYEPDCHSSQASACTRSPMQTIHTAIRALPAPQGNHHAVVAYQSPHRFYEIDPATRMDITSKIQFASFVTPEDRQIYFELFTLKASLQSIREVMDNLRQVQANIGTYYFAQQYVEKTVALAANYIHLVDKSKKNLASLMQVAEKGLEKIFSDPKRYKSANKDFERNMKILHSRFTDVTVGNDLIDTYAHRATDSMERYKTMMERLVVDLWSGTAADEVNQAMGTLFTQMDSLNKLLPAVIHGNDVPMISVEPLCHDAPSVTEPESSPVIPEIIHEDYNGLIPVMGGKVRGEWDPLTQRHPVTQVPIYTYRLFYNEMEIGSADYYGQPSLCASPDKTQHNILKAKGFFSELPLPLSTEINTVCTAAFPTLPERMWHAAPSAAAYGCLRGAKKVLGAGMQSVGFSQRTSKFTSNAMYYGAYFLSRYYQHQKRQAELEPSDNQWQAVYQAAYDTGELLIVGAVLNGVCHYVESAGKALQKRKWKKAASGLNALSQVGRYGVFAVSARESGIVEAGTSLVVGTAAEMLTVQAGKHMFD